MFTVRQSEGLDLLQLRDTLHTAGWDAIASDIVGEVAARREHVPRDGWWTLVIDRAGRFKFIHTRPVAKSQARHVIRSQRSYRLEADAKEIMTITGRIDDMTELPSLLEDLAQLADPSSTT